MVLKNGAVPLDILETLVDRYIADTKLLNKVLKLKQKAKAKFSPWLQPLTLSD